MAKNKGKKKALMGTIMFHLLLLLCFIFMGLKYQNPPPAEEGIAINFGFDDIGSGDTEPSIAEPTETKVVPVESADDISTQDVEEVSVVKEKPKETTTKPTEITEISEDKKEEKVVNTKALYPGKKEKNSTSQGVSNGDGNQGSEDGNPDANSYTGGGNGYDGIAFSLGGRTISEVKKPIYNSQAQGKVVVTIRVNQNGKVISAKPGAKGSTTTNAYLYSKAKEAALKTTFKPKADAPDVQIGTIIYHFKLN
jgi:TonB family protein